MQVWNVLHAARYTERQKSSKIVISAPSHNYIFATEARIDNRKKTFVKQQYLLHKSPQYGELRPTSGWDRSGSLGHPRKFQRVSRLRSVTAATSLNGSQPNVARCLAVSSAGTLHIHFRGFLPRYGILPGAKFTFILQVLRSVILVALLHGTWAVGANQTVRRWAHGATYVQ